MSLKNIFASVAKLTKKDRGQMMGKFFKTGPGQYAQGDIFAGLSNPQSRQIAKQNASLSFQDLQKLIISKIHEQRFIALVILTTRYKQNKLQCYNFYLKNLDYVNNWDLVDVSCYKIIGAFLLENREKIGILEELAKTDHLWRKRVAIISTLAFIKNKQNQYTYRIAKLLLQDKHDLIHKGVGWMLRQAGKNDKNQLQIFLKANYDAIPRTCLRYAIEKFPEDERQKMLKKQF